jgi:phage terminase large subunit-like protein
LSQEVKLNLQEGTEDWRKWRHYATVPEPGKRSALYFLMGKIVGLEDPNTIPGGMDPEEHYALCLFAEGATGIKEIDEARVKMIQMPRGTGKSALITGGEALRRLLLTDGYSIGIANETEGMAQKFLSQIKQQFEQNDLIRLLFPERIPDFKRTTWAATEIVIKRKKPRPVGPSVLATGVGGTKTGTHVDIWILDDLVSQDLAENAIRGNTTEIEKMERWIVRLPPMLNQPTRDPVLIIGTPWYSGDTYDFMERFFGKVPDGVTLDKAKKEYETIWNFPVPGTTKRQQIYLYRRGGPNGIAVFRKPALIDGVSTFPLIWTTEELHEMKAMPQTAAFFSANYLLDPTSGLASEFDMEDLRYYEWDGKQIEFYNRQGDLEYITQRDLVCYISVDPAFSDSTTAARTAIPVVGIYDQHIFLLEDFAEHGLGVYDIANKVIDFYLKYKPRTIFLETIVAQVALAEIIRRLAKERNLPNVPIEEIASHGRQKKESRIYGLEPYFRRKQFYIDRAHENFLQEYRAFPRGILRDLLDALSFQRDQWERTFSTADDNDSRIRERHETAIARLRAAVGKGGGY